MKTITPDLNPHPEEVRVLLGKNIRAGRHQQELSQMGLAVGAKLELSTIHRLESGKTDASLSSLARIRTALRVPWSHLLEGI
jgi:transcriptional regulator with XRE-family HTH domain